jgi:hypothetical protein
MADRQSKRMLPTTLTEAERAALAYARDFFTELPNEPSALRDLIGMSPLDPRAGRKFAVEALKRKATQEGWRGLTEVVDLAREGNVDAQDALDDLHKDCLHANVLPPPSLADYLIRRRPTKKRARSKTTNLFSDAAIVALVEQIVIRFGLRPMRNELHWGEPFGLSACAVAAIAASEARLNRGSESAINKLWQRFAPRIAASPPPEPPR